MFIANWSAGSPGVPESKVWTPTARTSVPSIPSPCGSWSPRAYTSAMPPWMPVLDTVMVPVYCREGLAGAAAASGAVSEAPTADSPRGTSRYGTRSAK